MIIVGLQAFRHLGKLRSYRHGYYIWGLPSGVPRLKLPSGPLNLPWKPLRLVLSQATHYGACVRIVRVVEFSWRMALLDHASVLITV
jgi:hypothetical protein